MHPLIYIYELTKSRTQIQIIILFDVSVLSENLMVILLLDSNSIVSPQLWCGEKCSREPNMLIWQTLFLNSDNINNGHKCKSTTSLVTEITRKMTNEKQNSDFVY